MNLQWTDDRWHLDGRGIHAGERLELLWPDGTWETVRVESSNGGRNLFAYFNHRGETIKVSVDPTRHELRWKGNQS